MHIDEFTWEALAINVARRHNSTDVIEALSDLFITRGIPGHIHSDNGLEFIPMALRAWIATVGAKTAYIEPGIPWANGYVESFIGKLGDELLSDEIFFNLADAKIVTERRRKHHNTISGYKPPALEVFSWQASEPLFQKLALN